jgi:predicted sulfurtransferase
LLLLYFSFNLSLTMPAFTNIAAYKFAPLRELKELQSELRQTCADAGMRGTILLSPEGINVFVAGERQAADELLKYLRTIPGLENLTAKISQSDHQPFNRMLVKIKKEIIAFGVPGIDPGRNPAPRVAPRQLKEWLDQGRFVTLLDTRNNYEIKLGTFRGARTLDLDHFREFPTAAASLPHYLRDQPVVTFCTGGIRCEKAAPLLQSAGFAQVFQLDGGILRYFEECGGEHFEGDCFVFDKRVAVDPSLRETGAALCFVCQTPLTVSEQEDPRYVMSVSCPHCYNAN